MTIPSVLPDRVQRLIDHIQTWCRDNNVTSVLQPTPHVITPPPDNLSCSGFFVDRPTPQLQVATDKPWEEWVLTLIHEHAHACQWHAQTPVWTAVMQDWGNGIEEEPPLGRWLDHEIEWDQATQDKAFEALRNVERDAEQRTLDMIVAFGLNDVIDIKQYAQKANAYVLFYNHVRATRQWYPIDSPPYATPRVWQAAPDTLVQDGQTPPQLQRAFEEAYPPPAPPKKPVL